MYIKDRWEQFTEITICFSVSLLYTIFFCHKCADILTIKAVTVLVQLVNVRDLERDASVSGLVGMPNNSYLIAIDRSNETFVFAVAFGPSYFVAVVLELVQKSP